VPRTKEAIATLRLFAKMQAKQVTFDKETGAPAAPTGDALFAKGVLAAVRWMTDPDSPIPYAELEEEMPEDGGWFSTDAIVHPEHAFQSAPAVIFQPDMIAPPPVNVPQFEAPRIIIPGEEPPDPNMNKKLSLPGSFTAALEEQPWLQPYVNEIASVQVAQGRHTYPNDWNAVVVGAGLESGPRLAGRGEGEEE